jgi:hypothetical protein
MGLHTVFRLKREFQYPLLPLPPPPPPPVSSSGFPLLERNNSLKLLGMGSHSHDPPPTTLVNHDMEENTDHLKADCHCIVT